MYDKELVRETIQLLEKTLEILLKRVSGITSVHDFWILKMVLFYWIVFV